MLEQLDKYDAKATFFCVGDNIRKHPEIFEMVKDQGHTLGNHTVNHLDGWSNENIAYFHNIRRCARQVGTDLFRPPYGRLKPQQALFLQRHYRIVMWDVLSGDFDPKLTPEQCYKNVIRNVRPGSIVVFHDSLKAWDKLKVALPKALEYLSAAGYSFNALHEQKMEQPQLVKSIA